MVYNITMVDDMLDTRYLFQPRGPGTAYHFRMKTPDVLVGVKNPRTGRSYGREIREGLGRTRSLQDARRRRDIVLGSIRVEEARARGEKDGSLEQALNLAAALKEANPDKVVYEYDVETVEGKTETATVTEREQLQDLIVDQAERLEHRVGLAKAQRWHKVATGKATPLKLVYEKYKKDPGQGHSRSTLNNLDTAVNDFLAYAGEDVAIEAVDRRTVAEFVTEHLPNKKGPKAPQGQGPATIQKKVSLLKQLWLWAGVRGFIGDSGLTPWDRQAPSKKAVRAVKKARRIYEPEEVKALLEAAPAGEALGDIIRVALLTGVRLEEIASLDAAQVEGKSAGYTIAEGKTPSAARYVPLVGDARKVIAARMKKAGGEGALFPELPVRKSTGRRGGAVSQKFTRLRRAVLGKETDGQLAQHALRHTWRTAARRAGVELRTVHELGGWSRGDNEDATYDHGLVREQYLKEQKRVAAWLRKEGYLG